MGEHVFVRQPVASGRDEPPPYESLGVRRFGNVRGEPAFVNSTLGVAASRRAWWRLAGWLAGWSERERLRASCH